MTDRNKEIIKQIEDIEEQLKRLQIELGNETPFGGYASNGLPATDSTNLAVAVESAGTTDGRGIIQSYSHVKLVFIFHRPNTTLVYSENTSIKTKLTY